MATPQEIASYVNSLARQDLRKLNQFLDAKVSEQELGATVEMQAKASAINSFSPAENTAFNSELTSLSGGTKDRHFPC